MTVHAAAAPPPTRRLVLGAGVFVLGWVVSIALVVPITASTLRASTTISAIVIFVGPKLGALAAIVIMGKAGFTYVKTRVFGFLKPPAEVSPTRYHIGISAFVVAIFGGFLEPYIMFLLSGDGRLDIRYSLAVDVLLLTSLFLLGGDFWDKVRSLFIRAAKVQFPARA